MKCPDALCTNDVMYCRWLRQPPIVGRCHAATIRPSSRPPGVGAMQPTSYRRTVLGRLRRTIVSTVGAKQLTSYHRTVVGNLQLGVGGMQLTSYGRTVLGSHRGSVPCSHRRTVVASSATSHRGSVPYSHRRTVVGDHPPGLTSTGGWWRGELYIFLFWNELTHCCLFSHNQRWNYRPVCYY